MENQIFSLSDIKSSHSRNLLEWVNENYQDFKLDFTKTNHNLVGVASHGDVGYWIYNVVDHDINPDLIDVIELFMLRAGVYLPDDKVIGEFAEILGIEHTESLDLWKKSNQQQMNLWQNCITNGWTFVSKRFIMRPTDGVEFPWGPSARSLLPESTYEALKTDAIKNNYYCPTDKELVEKVISRGWEYDAKTKMIYNPQDEGYLVTNSNELAPDARQAFLLEWNKPDPIDSKITTSRDSKVKKNSVASSTAKQLKCPLCSSEMVKRNSDFGPFWGCIKYPECRGKRKMEEKKINAGKKEDIQKKIDLTVKYIEGIGGSTSEAREWIAMVERLNSMIT